MAEVLQNDWFTDALEDAFDWQSDNAHLKMKLVQQTTGTTFPTTAQTVVVSATSQPTSDQVRITINELFTATADWGVIDRVELGYWDENNFGRTWNIYIRDTANTNNATTWDMAASGFKLTIRYMFFEFIEAV